MSFYYKGFQYSDLLLVTPIGLIDAKKEFDFRINTYGSGNIPHYAQLCIYDYGEGTIKEENLIFTENRVDIYGSDYGGYYHYILPPNTITNGNKYFITFVPVEYDYSTETVTLMTTRRTYSVMAVSDSTFTILNPPSASSHGCIPSYKYTFNVKFEGEDDSAYNVENFRLNYYNKIGYVTHIPLEEATKGEDGALYFSVDVGGLHAEYGSTTFYFSAIYDSYNNLVKTYGFSFRTEYKGIERFHDLSTVTNNCKKGNLQYKNRIIYFQEGGGSYSTSTYLSPYYLKDGGLTLSQKADTSTYGYGSYLYWYHDISYTAPYNEEFYTDKFNLKLLYKPNFATYYEDTIPDYYFNGSAWSSTFFEDRVFTYSLRLLRVGENKFCIAFMLYGHAYGTPFSNKLCCLKLSDIYENVTRDTLFGINLIKNKGDINLNVIVLDYGDPNAPKVKRSQNTWTEQCNFSIPKEFYLEEAREYLNITNDTDRKMNYLYVYSDTFFYYYITKDINKKLDYNMDETWNEDTVFLCDFNWNLQGGSIYDHNLVYCELYKEKNGEQELIKKEGNDYNTYFTMKDLKYTDFDFAKGDNINYKIIYYFADYNDYAPTEYITYNNPILIDFNSVLTVVYNSDENFALQKVSYGETKKNRPSVDYEIYDYWTNKKFPIHDFSSNLDYKSGSLSATMLGEDYEQGKKVDRKSAQKQAEDFYKFLNTNTKKKIKDWNGNVINVMFTSPSISYNSNYGNGIPTVSANWTEVD